MQKALKALCILLRKKISKQNQFTFDGNEEERVGDRKERCCGVVRARASWKKPGDTIAPMSHVRKSRDADSHN